MNVDVDVEAQFIREKYWEYEYEEVVTPNMYNLDLWKTSGHAEHYKQNMFLIDIEKQEFGLKPMNCPGASPQKPKAFPTSSRKIPSNVSIPPGKKKKKNLPCQLAQSSSNNTLPPIHSCFKGPPARTSTPLWIPCT